MFKHFVVLRLPAQRSCIDGTNCYAPAACDYVHQRRIAASSTISEVQQTGENLFAILFHSNSFVPGPLPSTLHTLVLNDELSVDIT